MYFSELNHPIIDQKEVVKFINYILEKSVILIDTFVCHDDESNHIPHRCDYLSDYSTWYLHQTSYFIS